jgi:hypothetical protein
VRQESVDHDAPAAAVDVHRAHIPHGEAAREGAEDEGGGEGGFLGAGGEEEVAEEDGGGEGGGVGLDTEDAGDVEVGDGGHIGYGREGQNITLLFFGNS